MVTGINALAKASLMAQKILNIISLISFVLVAAITGGGIFGYLWITNEKTQEKLKQQLVEQVAGSLKMPGLSGPVLPTAPPKATGDAGLSIPKF
jgi:archaellin